MSGLPLGLLIEAVVAVLLATTIGYCIVLNRKLKSLQTDRAVLAQMIGDLVNATNMANGAISGLRAAALEADEVLDRRVNEAERCGVALANHISSGSTVIDRIARITSAVERPAAEEPRKARAALETLAERIQRRSA